MLYSEFVAEYNESDTHKYKLPSADEYHQIIEPVYEFHPADFDKGEIVALYEIGGMSIMNLLIRDADSCCNIENDIQKYKNEIERLNQKYDEIHKEWAPNKK